MSTEIENFKMGIEALHSELAGMVEKLNKQDAEIADCEKQAAEARTRYDACLNIGDSEGMSKALATIAESRKKAEKLRAGRQKPAFLNRLAEIEAEQSRLNLLAGQEQQAAAEAIRLAHVRKDEAEAFRRRATGLLSPITAVRDLIGESSGV